MEMIMNENPKGPVTEQELAAKATGRRVTLADVEAAIASASYFRAGQAADNAARLGQSVHLELDDFNALQCLTFCVLTLKNGFTVTGQSACADPNNYNEEIGQRIAREDAVKKIWPLLGFGLREAMHQEAALLATCPFSPQEGMAVYIGTKVVYATPMSRAVYNDFRGWTMPADEQDDEGYLVEYADGGRANVDGYLGYISWSPKDVFERSYRAVGQAVSTSASESEPAPGPKGEGARDPAQEEKKEESWVDRLQAEFAELHERCIKLERFFETPAYEEVDPEDAKLLLEQYRHMVGYHGTLSVRLMRATRAIQDEAAEKLH